MFTLQVRNQENLLVYHFEIKLTVSSFDHTWSATPAVIGGVNDTMPEVRESVAYWGNNQD